MPTLLLLVNRIWNCRSCQPSPDCCVGWLALTPAALLAATKPLYAEPGPGGWAELSHQQLAVIVMSHALIKNTTTHIKHNFFISDTSRRTNGLRGRGPQVSRLLDLPRSDKRYNCRGPRGSGGLCQGQDRQRQGTKGISDQGLQAPVC